MTVFGANVASDHNCFWTSAQPVFRYNNASFFLLETYRAASGLDRDSVFAYPQFVISTAITPLDFRPTQAQHATPQLCTFRWQTRPTAVLTIMSKSSRRTNHRSVAGR